MLSFFTEHKILISCILFLFLISILLQIITGHFLSALIKETENMASTDKRILRECKRKFTNCYKTNSGVLNVGIFVDKFLNKMSIGKMPILKLKHFSGQLMLLSVFIDGIGTCRGIITGKTLGDILPFYIVNLFGLYIYFSIGGAIDITGKRRVLKINIVDYLENNLVNKLSILEEDLKIIEQDSDIMEKEGKKRIYFGRNEEKELEELLKEFLT